MLIGLASVFGSANAQDTAWPPASKETVDTMNMRMAVIQGLPDSVAVRNPLIFVNKVDDDEHDLYVLNGYLRNVLVRATMLSPDPDIRGRAKAYAKVMLVNMDGKAVKTLTTNQAGIANFDIGEMDIPDGLYRVRVDYGDKHTQNGTKPKSRLELHVTPRVSLSANDAASVNQRLGNANPGNARQGNMGAGNARRGVSNQMRR